MTVMYKPPCRNTIGSPDKLPLTYEQESKADLGSVQVAPGSPVCDTP
jgi:hypothetical protein